ncbi:MAG: response regulator, partial [Leptospiraceae bacterium]|nr:response regulator [Leptospiraceae bacterium]
NRHVGIRLLDGGKIIYDEHHPEDPDFDADPLYTTKINVPMYGRIWEFDMRSDSTFRALSFNPQPFTILIGGVAIDVMLMFLFIGLTQSNRKAAAYADRVTIELRKRKEELEKRNTTLHEQSEKIMQARRDADTARLAAEKVARARAAFLAIMSHELRTPLNGVIASAELLPGASSENERGELIETILHSGQTLLALINDILDFSRLEAGKVQLTPRATSIKDAFDEVILVLQSMIASHHDTVTQYIAPDVPARIFIDPLRLEQILLNLTSNAVKFTDYGAVRLKCSVEELSADQVSLLFEVIDSGIGINDTSEIFNEFMQVRSTDNQGQGGTGLGLAICKRLVEAMDGEIGVESESRAGSRFWFRVRAPIAPETTQASELSANVQQGSDALTRGEALVVDDNEINLSITVRMLKHLGWKADQARDGREALEAARHKRYHLIFMDCRMPVMDGYEATRRIRELRPMGEPIIALTANALPEDKQRCLAVGMSDHLGKPIDLEHMRNILIKWGPQSEQSSEVSTPESAGT